MTTLLKWFWAAFPDWEKGSRENPTPGDPQTRSEGSKHHPALQIQTQHHCKARQSQHQAVFSGWKWVYLALRDSSELHFITCFSSWFCTKGCSHKPWALRVPRVQPRAGTGISVLFRNGTQGTALIRKSCFTMKCTHRTTAASARKFILCLFFFFPSWTKLK